MAKRKITCVSYWKDGRIDKECFHKKKDALAFARKLRKSIKVK